MELIVILLGQFLSVFVGGMVVLLAEICVLALSGILSIVGLVVERRAATAGPQPPASQPRPGTSPATVPVPTPHRTPRRWPRYFAAVAGFLLLATGATFWILDSMYFEDTLRWALGKVHHRTGVRVTFASARGSMLAGSLDLQGVRVVQQDGERTRCDLAIEQCSARMAITTLLYDTVQIDRLELSSLTGTFDRIGGDRTPPTTRAPEFEIREFRIRNLQVQYAEHRPDGRRSFAVSTPEWHSEPLRSRWLPFDILFRSNCRGTVAGAAFEIRCEEVGDGRVTTWRATGLPLWYLADEIGGPFRRLQGGVADVEVVDSWSLQKLEIDSRWKLLMRDYEATVPADLSPLERANYVPWVRALNKLKGKPLEFRFEMDGHKFTTHHSKGSKGIWVGLGMAMVQKLLTIR